MMKFSHFLILHSFRRGGSLFVIPFCYPGQFEKYYSLTTQTLMLAETA